MTLTVKKKKKLLLQMEVISLQLEVINKMAYHEESCNVERCSWDSISTDECRSLSGLRELGLHASQRPDCFSHS